MRRAATYRDDKSSHNPHTGQTESTHEFAHYVVWRITVLCLLVPSPGCGQRPAMFNGIGKEQPRPQDIRAYLQPLSVCSGEAWELAPVRLSSS